MVVFTKKNVRFNIGSTVNTLLVLVGGEKRIFRKRDHKIQDFFFSLLSRRFSCCCNPSTFLQCSLLSDLTPIFFYVIYAREGVVCFEGGVRNKKNTKYFRGNYEGFLPLVPGAPEMSMSLLSDCSRGQLVIQPREQYFSSDLNARTQLESC